MPVRLSRRRLLITAPVGLVPLLAMMTGCSPQPDAPPVRPGASGQLETPLERGRSTSADQAVPGTAPSLRRTLPGAALRLYLPPALHAAPLFLAADLGFFKEEGFDTRIEVGSLPSETLALHVFYGHFDGFVAETDATLPGLFDAAPLLAVAAGEVVRAGQQHAGLLVSGRAWREGVTAPSALPGFLRELHLPGSVDRSLGRKLYRFLEHHGLGDPRSELAIQEWVNPAPLNQSFIGGRIDLLFAEQPRLSLLQEQLDAQIIGWDGDVPALDGDPMQVLLIGEPWLSEHPERGLRFATAYLRGVRAYLEQVNAGWRDEAVRIIVANRIGANPRLFDRIAGPSIPADGELDPARVEQAIARAVAGDGGQSLGDRSWHAYFDLQYVRQAAARLG